MKKIVYTMTFLLVLLFKSEALLAQSFDKIEDLDFPKRVGYVNDFSNIFTSDTVQILEKKLKRYEEETGRMFLVVSFPVLSCIFEEEECASAFYNRWQIKKIRKNHHAILLFLSGGNRRGERSYLAFSHGEDEELIYRAGHNQFTIYTVDKLIAEGKVAEANVAYINFVMKILSNPIDDK